MNSRRESGIARAGLVPLLCLALCASAWAAPEAPAHKHKRKHAHGVQQSLTVTATAYNATPKQTDRDPLVGAWGDRLDQLKPGFRAIAVSPDLAGKGLTHHRRVRIQGFKGEFLVLDRTAPQWQDTIDIFMGSDVAAARRFGRKQLKVYWTVPAPRAGDKQRPAATP